MEIMKVHIIFNTLMYSYMWKLLHFKDCDFSLSTLLIIDS